MGSPLPGAVPDPLTPLRQLSALYERVEAAAADFAEKAVGSSVFAELLATSVTNTMVLAGALNAAVDRGIRATRLAGRADVTRVAAQLARTEDKLERLLQEVRELAAGLAIQPGSGSTPGPGSTPGLGSAPGSGSAPGTGTGPGPAPSRRAGSRNGVVAAEARR